MINETEEFNYELLIKHKEAKNIRHWLKINTLNNKIQNNGDAVSYSFTFLPYKPFKTAIDMIISKKSGGRWRIKIILEAKEPEFFETINIIS